MLDEQAKVPQFIRRVMRTASEAELVEAAGTFRNYIAIVRRIYERVLVEREQLDSRDSGECARVNNATNNV